MKSKHDRRRRVTIVVHNGRCSKGLLKKIQIVTNWPNKSGINVRTEYYLYLYIIVIHAHTF